MARKLSIPLYIASAFVMSISMLISVASWNPDLEIRAEIKSLIDEKGALEVISLEPRKSNTRLNNREFFHGYKILGSTLLKNPEDRRKLLSAFIEDIPSSTPALMCFNPRHGIRFRGQDKTIDLLICFECMSTRYFGPKGERRLSNRNSSEPEFDALLKQKNIPLAPKAAP